MRVELSLLYKSNEWLEGRRAANRRQGKSDSMGLTIKHPLACLEIIEPLVSQFVGRPEGSEVEIGVERFVDDLHRQFNRGARTDSSQRIDRLEPDTRVFVGDRCRQQVHGVWDEVPPVGQNSHGGRPHAGIGRCENLNQQLRFGLP